MIPDDMTPVSVLGAQGGNEGKGVVIAAIAAAWAANRQPAVNIRLNGCSKHRKGVMLGNTRLTLHSLGAGSLARVPTHFSKNWAHNPFDLATEMVLFNKKAPLTRLTADPRGMVITPWDSALEQAMVVEKGTNLTPFDGSGLHTAWARRNTPVGIVLSDLFEPEKNLHERLQEARHLATQEAIQTHGLAADNPFLLFAQDDNVLWNLLEAKRAFRRFVTLCQDEDLDPSERKLCEGVCGILSGSESDHPAPLPFPTGTTALHSLTSEPGTIVWTSGMTTTRIRDPRHRHPKPLGMKHEDWTHPDSLWTGHRSWEPLDVTETCIRIQQNMKNRPQDKVLMALTGLDQFEHVPITENKHKHWIKPDDVVCLFENHIPVTMTSHGPRHDDVLWRTPNGPTRS